MAGALAVASARATNAASPVARSDGDQPDPSLKQLPAEWLASLRDRGEPTVYRGGELAFIGMPIGGITAGQLYLGGDGRLWLWDIFNQTRPTEQPGAEHYSSPMLAVYYPSVDQGFTLTISDGKDRRAYNLAADGFSDISFRGEYPIGYVTYRDPACPLSVLLEAFSPFIPLSVDDSSLPATILRFRS